MLKKMTSIWVAPVVIYDINGKIRWGKLDGGHREPNLGKIG